MNRRDLIKTTLGAIAGLITAPVHAMINEQSIPTLGPCCPKCGQMVFGYHYHFDAYKHDSVEDQAWFLPCRCETDLSNAHKIWTHTQERP
jgi:hypothetical protein